MALKFGTSGVRGLAVELDEAAVSAYTRAFITTGDIGKGVYVARDRRASSPVISGYVIAAAQALGVDVIDCGEVATPALAMAAAQAGAAAVMVTGSHIPADRNGLKFYRPQGEITKADEALITAALHQPTEHISQPGTLSKRHDLGVLWGARFADVLGKEALSSLRIGVWGHSAVCRDDVVIALEALGALVIRLDWRDGFVAVDTEAVDEDTRRQLANWASTHELDAIVSTDGDGDRPMVADAKGQIIPGDILGQITAHFVGAKTVVTPVSSNTGIDVGGFDRVIRTKIGSPYVISGMEEARGDVFGYEANGGVLLGFDAKLSPNKTIISALWTRDSLLPIVATLVSAKASGGLAARVEKEPARFTASGRLQDIAPETSGAWLQGLIGDTQARHEFLETLGLEEAGHDLTDGLRILLKDKEIIHLRPSGNAPEFRIYSEASSYGRALEINDKAKDLIKQALAS